MGAITVDAFWVDLSRFTEVLSQMGTGAFNAARRIPTVVARMVEMLTCEALGRFV